VILHQIKNIMAAVKIYLLFKIEIVSLHFAETTVTIERIFACNQCTWLFRIFS